MTVVVHIEFGLCGRIVRHIDYLAGWVPQGRRNLVMATFGRTWYEVMADQRQKYISITDTLRKELQCLDREVMDIITTKEDLPEDFTLKLYQDFTTLKLLLGL